MTLPPDDQRCEALVVGHPSYHWEWVRVDHRCPRRANQSRGPLSVCHVHARSKNLTPWRCESG